MLYVKTENTDPIRFQNIVSAMQFGDFIVSSLTDVKSGKIYQLDKDYYFSDNAYLKANWVNK